MTLNGRALPTFLIAGPHAERDPQFREQLAAAGSRWKLVQTYDYAPSTLVWLDLHDPRNAGGRAGRERSRVSAVRVSAVGDDASATILQVAADACWTVESTLPPDLSSRSPSLQWPALKAPAPTPQLTSGASTPAKASGWP